MLEEKDQEKIFEEKAILIANGFFRVCQKALSDTDPVSDGIIAQLALSSIIGTLLKAQIQQFREAGLKTSSLLSLFAESLNKTFADINANYCVINCAPVDGTERR